MIDHLGNTVAGLNHTSSCSSSFSAPAVFDIDADDLAVSPAACHPALPRRCWWP